MGSAGCAIVSSTRHRCTEYEPIGQADALEQNQWFYDAVGLALHHLESAFEFGEAKGMCCQTSGIDTPVFDKPEQPLHPQATAGAKTGPNSFFRHSDAPFHARDMHEVAFAVIAGIGNGAARLGHAH